MVDLSLKDELVKDLDDLDDDDDVDVDDEPGSLASIKPEDFNDEEWQIKCSIGQDCTLDYEEEEDEYDKLAVNSEKPEERLYMKDINDYGIAIDSNYELPDSIEEVERDPRANHLAAKIRLKEDAEAAQQIDSLRVSEKDAPAREDESNTSEDGVKLKSILKRKDGPSDSKSDKRVRFEPECKDNCSGGSEGDNDIPMDTGFVENAMVSNEANFSSAVPDYIRNPSKYTHYTFDSSSDMDEESNKQAYMDFLKLLNRSNDMDSQQQDASNDLPSVTFIPKRKTGDTIMVDNATVSKQNRDDLGKEFMRRRGLPVRIAAWAMEDNEVCAMEEDEMKPLEDGSNSSQRLGRKYRMKSKVESDESIA